MDRYPAVALLELSGVAAGIQAGDAMVKRAPVAVLKTGTVHNGKYLVFAGGSVAAVEEAYEAGLQSGGDAVLDRVFLPDVHDQVHDAALGLRKTCAGDALGIIETATVAGLLKAADAGVKGADVSVVEIRLADDLGGHAFALFAGALEEVEAAVELSREAVTRPDVWLHDRIVPRLHGEMAGQIDQTTRFACARLDHLEGGEI